MNLIYESNNTDELMHYGVPGMKWGKRKVRPQSGLDIAKSNYKTAKKEYSKSYNKAYSYSSRHPVSQFVGKKAKAESDRRWQDAYDKAENVRKAKDAYKNTKRTNKTSKNAGAAIGKHIGNKLNKNREKRNAEIERVKKRTDTWGANVNALSSVYENRSRRAGRAAATHIINTLANNVQLSNANYYTKRGVDIARKISMSALSLGQLKDNINTVRNISTGYEHQRNKRR